MKVKSWRLVYKTTTRQHTIHFYSILQNPNGSANDLASSFTLYKKASGNKKWEMIICNFIFLLMTKLLLISYSKFKGSVDNCMKIHFHAVINQSSWLPLSSFELLILAKNSSGDQYLFSPLFER